MSASVSFARTRRSLDRNQAALDCCRYPEGGIEARLSVMLDLLTANARRHAHESVPPEKARRPPSLDRQPIGQCEPMRSQEHQS
jgi:hypothetical protein